MNATPVPPSFTTQPASLTVTEPAGATFSVVVTGDAPLSYQWRRNGTAISGATSASYVLNPTAMADNGAQFDVIVSNAVGSITSTVATLTVNPAPAPPSITTQPTNVTVTAPSAANFSVVATGDAPLSYQWRRNGVDIVGATSSSYTLDPTALEDSGAHFSVVVPTPWAQPPLVGDADRQHNAQHHHAARDVTESHPRRQRLQWWPPARRHSPYQWRRNGVAIGGARARATSSTRPPRQTAAPRSTSWFQRRGGTGDERAAT